MTCFFSTQEELQKATDELTGQEFEGSEIVFTKKEDQGEIMGEDCQLLSVTGLSGQVFWDKLLLIVEIEYVIEVVCLFMHDDRH